MTSVSSLIFSTAFASSMTLVEFFCRVANISRASFTDAVADSFNFAALSSISPDNSSPSMDILLISSDSSFISSMLDTSVCVVAVVSCIPAASSSVVAELSVQESFTSAEVTCSVLTISFRCVLELPMSWMTFRRLSRIAATALAMAPHSSFPFTSFLFHG